MVSKWLKQFLVYRVHRLKLLGEILRLLLALEDWCYNLLAFFWEAEANANQQRRMTYPLCRPCSRFAFSSACLNIVPRAFPSFRENSPRNKVAAFMGKTLKKSDAYSLGYESEGEGRFFFILFGYFDHSSANLPSSVSPKTSRLLCHTKTFGQ